MSNHPPVPERLPADAAAFEGLNAVVLCAGIGKARTELFKSKILEFGGIVSEDLGSASSANRPNHLIVDDNMTGDRLLRILKVDSSSELNGITIVRSSWLSECIKARCLLKSVDSEIIFSNGALNGRSLVRNNCESDADVHSVLPSSSSTSTSASKSYKRFKKESSAVAKDSSKWDSDFQESLSDDEGEKEENNCAASTLLRKGTWVCAQSSSCQKVNYNQHITDHLEAMAKKYESINDKWRALGYQKAIMALKRCDKAITSFEEAKAIPGIGVRLAEKIWEIVESGELQKLKELTSQEEIKALELFTNVWGAGAHTARTWVQRGYRTLDDLKSQDAGLTKNQQVGLKYYDEFLERMPRDEAAQIEAVVKDMALSIQAGLTVMACGSYRRGKQTCGDVDVLVTHPDGHSHVGVFAKLLTRLTDTGFLTDHLVSVESNGEQQKYLGVCQLPGKDSKHRRLDIIVVPYNEYACACLYFTGSAHFNRSMRNLASRMNMSLNEHALYSGVVRTRGVKVNQGVPLHTPTEESIFAHLGLTYRLPEERDH